MIVNGTDRVKRVVCPFFAWFPSGDRYIERGNNMVLLTAENIRKSYGTRVIFDYISFSMNICKELVREAPDAPVYYLEGDVTPKELKELGVAGFDYHYKILQKHPEWIKEAHELGMKTNSWTVNDEKVMRWLIDQKIDFITTDKPVELKQILLEK